MKLTAKIDTDAYCITFGAAPTRTPIKKGEALLFNFVKGANYYVAATADFEPPEKR